MSAKKKKDVAAKQDVQPELFDETVKKESANGEAGAAEESVQTPQEEVYTITAEQMVKVEKALREREEYLQALTRSQSEFENYRRRNAQARQDAYDEGARDAIANLLPVLDNFDLAAQSIPDDTEDPIAKGVALVRKSLYAALEKQGLEEVPSQGVPFDPELHNAVMREPVKEAERDGEITQVMQKGYRIGEKIIRYAMVKVAYLED